MPSQTENYAFIVDVQREDLLSCQNAIYLGE